MRLMAIELSMEKRGAQRVEKFACDRTGIPLRGCYDALAQRTTRGAFWAVC